MPRRRHSTSSDVGGRDATSLLRKRDISSPRSVHKTSSPPPYIASRLLTDKRSGVNLEQLTNRDYRDTERKSRSLYRGSDRTRRSSSVPRQSIVDSSASPTYDGRATKHQSLVPLSRSPSLGGSSSTPRSSRRQRSLSPSLPPPSSASKLADIATENSNASALSEPRQRRASDKRRDGFKSPSSRVSDIFKSDSPATKEKKLTDAELETVEHAKSILRRTASIDSVADALKLEEEKRKVSEELEKMKLSSRGSFDNLNGVEKTSSPSGKRKKSPKHRIRSMLKSLKGN